MPTATPQHKIGSGFGARSTAWETLQGIDLTGKLAIVTGGYSGVGLETTRALAGAGAQVVVPARRRAAAEQALAEVDGVDRGTKLATATAHHSAGAAPRGTARHVTPRAWHGSAPVRATVFVTRWSPSRRRAVLR
ncbi:MAG TPA: SDR family NAD(P)-dependent oxidoreductase [Solirubrobacteraceae bacterium]|nr:SDR family NAD(P)-dependent oxidoreductase [Solirubrobacteraceae bacterium]